MENLQNVNEITNDIECQICLEKFIKLTNKEFNKFLEDNVEILPDTFEDDNCGRCYEDRFECLMCKNIVCEQCYLNIKNHKRKPHEHDIGYYEYCGGLDEDGLVEGMPGLECPIMCPFCRTKDYKIFYGNEFYGHQIPYELLNEIKLRRFK